MKAIKKEAPISFIDTSVIFTAIQLYILVDTM